MARFRYEVSIEIDRDDVPGFGYHPESHIRYIRKMLEQTLPHYKPTVFVHKCELGSKPTVEGYMQFLNCPIEETVRHG
jgi:hypothetical protein